MLSQLEHRHTDYVLKISLRVNFGINYRELNFKKRRTITFVGDHVRD